MRKDKSDKVDKMTIFKNIFDEVRITNLVTCATIFFPKFGQCSTTNYILRRLGQDHLEAFHLKAMVNLSHLSIFFPNCFKFFTSNYYLGVHNIIDS